MTREEKKLILKHIITGYYSMIFYQADADGVSSGVKDGEEEQALDILNSL